jgi:DNA recombination protein RmuC
MIEWWWLGLLVLNSLGLLWLALRRPDATGSDSLRLALEALAASQREQADRLAREQRAELQDSARAIRQELAAALTLFQQSLLTQGGEVARTQNEQIEAFRGQLTALQQQLALSLQQATAQLVQQGQAAREAQDGALRRQADSSAEALQRFGSAQAAQLSALSEANERRLGEVRQAVEGRLAALQQGNEAKLDQMRATVDEKLHATLEQRLGESFKQVAERLEQVHQGLGEMQVLARDVGSLNRVLTNVKSRGIYGEVQLAGLLEQVLTPEQYAANVETVPGSGARVEFAIRLPV